MRRVLLFGLVVVTTTHAQAPSPPAKEALRWAFSGFVASYEKQSWQEVYQYLTPRTQMSFGGASGREGFDRIYKDNPRCYQDMLLALKQGSGPLECVAPPQWDDPQVIYLGARANFVYDHKNERLYATDMICGGD